MLNNVFRINFPYGMEKVNEVWFFFNREYLPLGYHNQFKTFNDWGNYAVNYKGITEKFLIELADEKKDNGGAVHKNEKGEITRIFFYNDTSNPTQNHNTKNKNKYFKQYFDKIKKISNLKIYEKNIY